MAYKPLDTRGRFWRRMVALIIDGVLVIVFVAVLGLVLFAPTAGRIRVESVPFIQFTACKNYVPKDTPLGIDLPPGFTVSRPVRGISSGSFTISCCE